jgi:DNA-3-methyladenine glycosylase II
MNILYGLEKISKEEFDVIRARYTPYGSVASLYLWAIAGGALSSLD